MKNSVKNIIFDLDGTLTDSKEGIVNCLRFALEKSEKINVDDEALMAYIGEPLSVIFEELLNDKAGDSIDKAIEFYRERFAEKGIYENRLYEGIDVLIGNLKKRGYSIYLATIKPKEYAEKILAHFNLLSDFDYVMGTGMNGEMSSKEELIGHVIKLFNLDRKKTMMVGDRVSDCRGAEANGILCGAALYGYGCSSEFDSVKTEAKFESVESMERFFL